MDQNQASARPHGSQGLVLIGHAVSIPSSYLWKLHWHPGTKTKPLHERVRKACWPFPALFAALFTYCQLPRKFPNATLTQVVSSVVRKLLKLIRSSHLYLQDGPCLLLHITMAVWDAVRCTHFSLVIPHKTWGWSGSTDVDVFESTGCLSEANHKAKLKFLCLTRMLQLGHHRTLRNHKSEHKHSHGVTNVWQQVFGMRARISPMQPCWWIL